MQLNGTISEDRPLLVVAMKEEAQFLDGDLPVLLTGLGKVNAASALAEALAEGARPSYVLNLGTAGALKPGLTGTHLVSSVMQHDLDTDFIRALTGVTFGAPLTLADKDGLVLATGDTFVADDAGRARLAAQADLVDMEGYALASAAADAGVPLRIVKHVSDDAGDGAAKSWRESVTDCGRVLAGWAKENLPYRL